MGKRIDTEFTDHPTCPYCGHVDRDAWEWDDNGEDFKDHECVSCGFLFDAQKHVTVRWSTKPLVQVVRKAKEGEGG